MVAPRLQCHPNYRRSLPHRPRPVNVRDVSRDKENGSHGPLIYLLPNGRQSRGLHALAYRILEVFLQTGAVLGLMVVRQS